MDTKKPTDHSEEKAKEEPSASDVVEDNETEKVSYIPSFTDTTEDGDPLILRASPQQLIWNTIKHGIYHIWALPLIVVPLGPWAMSSPYSELGFNWDNMYSLACQVGLFFVAVIAIAGAFTASCWVWLPPVVWVAGFVALVAALEYIALPLNRGSEDGLLYSQPRNQYPGKPEEKWFFINGVTVGTHWLQLNIDALQHVFHRPITGLQNTTKGLVLDLIECVLQRAFMFATTDSRHIHNQVKIALHDPKVKRVVVIAHSQGGIMLSAVLEALFSELDEKMLRKIEVYTFGCAAVRFPNPVRDVVDANGVETRKRLISVIEHYANSVDFVARVGVLRFVLTPHKGVEKGEPESLFSGKVFVRKGKKGHMFGLHYLVPMFTDEKERFLNAEVRVEQEEVERVAEKEGMGKAGMEGVKEVARRAKLEQGKKVRDLSRLWRYRNGGTPD